MKKLILSLVATAMVGSAFALPKAFYVKQGDNISKYNFGVAENLLFSENGTRLSVRGYGETIDLTAIDYISFSPLFSQAITPTAQKEKLVQIGNEAYGMFDLHDQADILNMIHVFFDETEDAAGNPIVPPVEYYVDPEYYNIHGEINSLPKALLKLASGDASAARVLRAKVVNLYKVEDYLGKYTANSTTLKWEKTAADNFQLVFFGNGHSYTITLTPSKNFTTWNTVDFNGQFPKVIDIIVAQDDKNLATAKLTTELVQDQSILMNLDFEANGYVVNDNLKISNTVMTDDVKVTIKGKEYLNATSVVEGNNFVNYDVMYDAIQSANGYYDEKTDEDFDGDASKLMACFTRANSNVDLIGKLQAKAKIANPSRVYNWMRNVDDADSGYFERDGFSFYCLGKVIEQSGDTYHITRDSKDDVEKLTLGLNDYTDMSIYYDGEAALQAYIGFETNDEQEDYYCNVSDNNAYTIVDGYIISVYRPDTSSPWIYYGYNDNGEQKEVTVCESEIVRPAAIYEHWYENMPLVMFPDNTSFAVEDYFDETSFSKLIDDYNEIIDTYLSITGQDREVEK
jgi:hypothetical protein